MDLATVCEKVTAMDDAAIIAQITEIEKRKDVAKIVALAESFCYDRAICRCLKLPYDDLRRCHVARAEVAAYLLRSDAP